MGQSATLYRIAKTDFSKVEENPYDFGLFKINKAFETFIKSFEGLKFVLSKEQNAEGIILVDQIFYPKNWLGEKIDYSKLDFDNLPEDTDLLKEPVYYNEPIIVNQIAALLEKITTEWFQGNFDSEELNKADIYPGNVWNNRTEREYAFNANHMTQQFELLKEFYKSASNDSDYVLSYIG